MEERKIGEIFEDNGEWYQCLKDKYCNHCAFVHDNCASWEEDSKREVIGQCSSEYRSDGEEVIFKKLEKVGEPYEYFIQNRGIIMVQEYILKNPSYIWDDKKDVFVRDFHNGRVAIEIKQKEDMEEKKEDKEERKVILGELLYKYINSKITYDAFEKEVIELCGNKGESKLTLKDFDLEAAKVGKPVCTRDGRKARIICFDAKFPKTGNIVTLVEKENGEEVTLYHYDDGHCSIGRAYDLMMLPEKKEGWVNVYKTDCGIIFSKQPYSTKEEAIKNIGSMLAIVDTVKVEWNE